MKSEMQHMEQELRACLKAIRRNLRDIILFGILGGLLGFMLTIVPEPPLYRAAGTISKTVASSSLNPVDNYLDLLNSKRVLEEALQAADGEITSMSEIASMLNASLNQSKSIISVVATHKNPQLAMQVANAATEAMVQQINETYNNPGVMVLDTAGSVTQVSSWRRTMILYRAGGVFIGLILACVFYALHTLFSRKTFGVTDCTLGGELELIGVIPRAPAKIPEDESYSHFV